MLLARASCGQVEYSRQQSANELNDPVLLQPQKSQLRRHVWTHSQMLLWPVDCPKSIPPNLNSAPLLRGDGEDPQVNEREEGI